MRTIGILSALAAAAVLSAAGAAADELTGTATRMHRSATTAGGDRSSGTGVRLEAATGEAAGVVFQGDTAQIVPGVSAISHYPGTVVDLTALTGDASGQVKLTWTAPGADGNQGTAPYYDIRIGTTPLLNQTDFAAAPVFSQAFTPLAPGATEQRVLTNLSAGVTYYVGVQAADGEGGHAFLSNPASAMPPSVLGVIAYTGSQGGPVALAVFTSTAFLTSAPFSSISQAYPGTFAVGVFPFSQNFYLAGFIDMNKNGRPDASEHFGVYGGVGTPSPVVVGPGQVVSGTDYSILVTTLTNQANVSGTVAYAGAVPGTFRVELHGDARFSGTPIAIHRAVASPGSYSIDVPGAAGYYLRAFLDRNADALFQAVEPSGYYSPTGQTADQVFVPANGTVTGTNFTMYEAGADGGQGTAVIVPSTAGAGGFYSGALRLNAGLDGISTGGQIVLGAPPAWGTLQNTCPTCAGFVSVTVQSTNTVAVLLDGDPATPAPDPISGASFVPAVVLSGSLNRGDTVQFDLTSLAVQCPVGDAPFSMATAQRPDLSAKTLVEGTPTAQVRPGSPTKVSVTPSVVSLVQFSTSQANLLTMLDDCGNPAPVRRSTSVVLTGQVYDFATGQYSDDAAMIFTQSLNASATAPATLSYKVGQSSASFYALTISSESTSIRFDFNVTGSTDSFYAPVQVFAVAAISSATVSTGAFASGLGAVSISPNGDSIDDIAFFSFATGASDLPWRIRIATAPWNERPPAIWTAAGRGPVAPGQVGWDGRLNLSARAGETAEIGTYHVRIEAAGFFDDSLRVSVLVGQVSGRVTDSETLPAAAIPGARVAAFGPVVARTFSDESGRFVLSGLTNGAYTLSFTQPGYRPLTAGATVLSAADHTADGPMQRASPLLVIPTLLPGTTQALEQRGRIAVHTPDWGRALFNPIRLLPGTTTFDDGGQWDPVLKRLIVRSRIRFELAEGTYTIDATLPGYITVTTTVYFGATGLTAVLDPFIPKAGLTGTLTLSTATNADPNPSGLTVTVQAVEVSTSALGAIASVRLSSGVTTSSFALAGLDPGSYLLTGSAPGFSAVQAGPVAVGTFTLTGVVLPPFTEGGVISGTVTVRRDDSELPALSVLGSTYPLSAELNAWAPGRASVGRSVVYLSSSAGNTQTGAAYRIAGLATGATHYVFARLTTAGNLSFDAVGGMPQAAFVDPGTGAGTLDFAFEPASGAVQVHFTLPDPNLYAGANPPDFTQLSVFGTVLESPDPFERGRSFTVLNSTRLPQFLCGGTLPTVAGACVPAVTSATFAVTNLRTGLLELTFAYGPTGHGLTRIVPIVGGSTTALTVEMTSPTYSVSGRIINRISEPLFNTNADLVANALFEAVPGFLSVSSSTARVEALRRDFADYAAPLSTGSYDTARTRAGFISAAGNYAVTGLPPGVYLLHTLPLRTVATGPVLVPAQERLVTISTFNLTGVDFTLTDGFTISGRVLLEGGVQDARSIGIDLTNSRGEVVSSTVTSLGQPGAGLIANAVNFSFTKVPAGGFYTLRVTDLTDPPKYAGRPHFVPDPTLSVGGLQSDRTGIDIPLKTAAAVIGRLRDAGTGTLITLSNAELLPQDFRIFAIANPFVEGGFTVSPSSVSGRPIESDGTFRLQPLFPGVAYDFHAEQRGWDLGLLGKGSQNYAPVTVAGLNLVPGQVLDLGVLDLDQGIAVTGVVTSTDGAPLANIGIKAVPSFEDSPVVVRTQTGPDGTFTLWVTSTVSRYADITAAPRDVAPPGAVYQESTLKNVDLSRPATADFTLGVLENAVVGQVATSDGGALSFPFGANKGFPAAAIFLQRLGTLSETDVLGEIQTQSRPDGGFTVAGLSSGTYNLTAASLGYDTASTTVTVTTGVVSAETLTLVRGGAVRGTILKPDPAAPGGFSCPSTREVAGVVAADTGFNEYLVGTVEVDPQLESVCRYSIAGFRTNVAYQLGLLGPGGEDVAFPTEGQVTFTPAELTATKTVNLTFRPAPVDCFATAKSLGNNRLQLKFRCTKPLRNLTDPDNDLSAILAKSTFSSEGTPHRFPDGTGTLPLNERRLEKGRRELTAIYRPAVGEGRFSIRLTAFSSFVDPNTGAEYQIDRVFDFFTAVQAVKSQQANNVLGANLSLEAAADEEERSGMVCGPGSFLADGEADPDPTLQVQVGMQKAETRKQAQVLALKRGIKITAEEDSALDNPRAVPDIIARAREALAAGRFAEGPSPQRVAKPPYVNALSAFYNIFLPAGIQSGLREKCRIRLSYDLALSSAANPTQLNVWFFNPVTLQYELEDEEKTIDTVNETITVSVGHFSVYTVLTSTPIADSTTPFTGGDLQVFNFPNPFNLEPKTKSLNVNPGGGAFGPGAAQVTTEGTVIRLGVPRGLSGDGKIRIFNVAGELVREYDTGPLAGNTAGAGTWYYFEWNGRNQSGSKVASGLYIGEIKLGGRKKFWKMVVIKEPKYK